MPAPDAAFEQLEPNRLQAGLSRQVMTFVETFKLFTPPGEADRTKMLVGARRNDVSECEIQVPERGKCRSQLARQLLERNAAVMIKPPLSDR